jgi:hypothetical protein
MSERYLLAQMVLSTNAEIELSKTEYEAIIQAAEKLLSCLDAEQKFDCIVENYRDLEKYILDQAFQALFSSSLDDVAFQAPRNTTSRKLSNLLSSVRLYQDTIGRHAKAITGDDAAAAKITADKSRQFDASLSYRILDALRNHAQHHALPVHGYSVRRQWTKDREISEHECEAVISVSELGANADFRPKTTLAELKAGPEKLELKPIVREYVECLSTIHHEFRELIKSAVDQQLRTVADAKARLFAAFPDARDIGLAVYLASDDGIKIGDETQISGTMSKYLDFLQKKNKHLVNFARRRIKC